MLTVVSGSCVGIVCGSVFVGLWRLSAFLLFGITILSLSFSVNTHLASLVFSRLFAYFQPPVLFTFSSVHSPSFS